MNEKEIIDLVMSSTAITLKEKKGLINLIQRWGVNTQKIKKILEKEKEGTKYISRSMESNFSAIQLNLNLPDHQKLLEIKRMELQEKDSLDNILTNL